MNLEKIDYNRINENEIIDDNGIDAAFQLKDLPVYVVYRHGRYKNVSVVIQQSTVWSIT